MTSVEREVVGEGKGFLGDIARLTLAYEGGEGPATVIAKLPKLANRAMGSCSGRTSARAASTTNWPPTCP